MTSLLLAELALPVPLRKTFDYLLPAELSSTACIGMRAEVPFGNQKLVGIIIGIKSESLIDNGKMKSVIRLLDNTAILAQPLLNTLTWASDYYQHPIGECFSAAIPNLLRKGDTLPELKETYWLLTAEGANQHPVKASKQKAILDYLHQHPRLADTSKKALGFSSTTLKTLAEKGWILSQDLPRASEAFSINDSSLALNDEQNSIISDFNARPCEFHAYLLEGITGSGKTEVYLQLIAHTLKQGKQALMLVPEIGLTPQTLDRFAARFNCPMAIFHSNLSNKQRLHYWQMAQNGIANIIIGTRSALFTASANLGLIIIDEEHDLSYKQQDGFKYSARDLAMVRAKYENIPIVLGSATPTLESLHNASSGKYFHWQLNTRAGSAQKPVVQTIDIRHKALMDGICQEAIDAIRDRCEKGEQSLIFINRRGFAPSLLCHECGWVSQCHACDARLTVHLNTRSMRCHHCSASESIPHQCPQCHSKQLIYAGAGTERIETGLQELFPDTPIFRVDRDSTSQKDAMQSLLTEIQQHDAAILVGTQMLAKGHHFPNVTLVIVLDTDAALMGTDYRAIERFGQLLTQVTGRAGREQKPGLALIQTHYPHHELLHKLLTHGYHRFAMDLLAERQQMHLPPFSYQALIRLEDQNAHRANATLLQLKMHLPANTCTSLGPYPATLQRRAHFFRFQLLIQAPQRHLLKQAVAAVIKASEPIIKPHLQRWSIDIDPQEMN